MRAGQHDPGVLYPKVWAVAILELWCRGVVDVATSFSPAADSLNDTITLLPSDSDHWDSSQQGKVTYSH